jgi:hypothetical protein
MDDEVAAEPADQGQDNNFVSELVAEYARAAMPQPDLSAAQLAYLETMIGTLQEELRRYLDSDSDYCTFGMNFADLVALAIDHSFRQYFLTTLSSRKGKISKLSLVFCFEYPQAQVFQIWRSMLRLDGVTPAMFSCALDIGTVLNGLTDNLHNLELADPFDARMLVFGYLVFQPLKKLKELDWEIGGPGNFLPFSLPIFVRF